MYETDIIILFGAMLITSSGAQTLLDSAVYIKGLRMIESSKTYQDFEAAGNILMC